MEFYEIAETAAEAIDAQIIDTEDMMLFNNWQEGWSVERYGDVVVKTSVFFEAGNNRVEYAIAIANASIFEDSVFETDDFEEAVLAATEAHFIALENEMAKVRF